MNIVEKLRTRGGRRDGFGLGLICDEAATEIERLNACIAELERDLAAAGARINVLAANESRLIDKIAAMLRALRKAVVVLAGVCEHAPEMGADEAYAIVSAAIEKATKQ